MPKIKTVKELAQIARAAKKTRKRLVLAHGVFDLIHWGHINYLKKAKEMGDLLIVSVVSDKFIGKSEVKKRPLLFNERIRSRWLAELEPVDFVVLCNDIGPWKIMEAVSPDFYARGTDSESRLRNPHSGLNKDKKKIEEMGGKLVFIKSLPIHSSDILVKDTTHGS